MSRDVFRINVGKLLGGRMCVCVSKTRFFVSNPVKILTGRKKILNQNKSSVSVMVYVQHGAAPKIQQLPPAFVHRHYP